ncbi:hypothetical protein CR513_55282, partial [Mucuna pruriens]
MEPPNLGPVFSQSNSIASVCTWPRPYQTSLGRERLGTLHLSFCIRLIRTQIHNRAHCVLERIRPRVDYTIDSTNTFAELEQMENNDKTLKELATPDVVYQPSRKTPQVFERIPCGLLHNEVVGDTGGLHQNEGVPWRHEMHVLGEVLPGIQDCDHQERNMWDKPTSWRDSTRILGKIQ